MKNKLRPIGTEFEVICPPIMGSTITKASIMKYRVIAHEKAFRYLEDKEGILSEVLEVISTRVDENENKTNNQL